MVSVQSVDIERKSKVLNVRLTERQRAAYERAAAIEGVSVSAFVTEVADDRAERVIRAHASMVVTTEVFDDLLAALDRPATLAPPLERALDDPRVENR